MTLFSSCFTVVHKNGSCIGVKYWFLDKSVACFFFFPSSYKTCKLNLLFPSSPDLPKVYGEGVSWKRGERPLQWSKYSIPDTYLSMMFTFGLFLPLSLISDFLLVLSSTFCIPGREFLLTVLAALSSELSLNLPASFRAVFLLSSLPIASPKPIGGRKSEAKDRLGTARGKLCPGAPS